jgi:cell division septation protein DedD
MPLSASPRRLLALAALLALPLVAGCSQTEKTARGPRAEDADDLPAPTLNLARYETFDASRFPARPAPVRVEIEHQVPEQLMQDRADQGVTQTVEGYRIQVYSSQRKDSSEDVVRDVEAWWEEVKDEAPPQLFPEELPVTIEYGQPYYRVRVGAYEERERALEALQFVRQQYADAFLARTTVTVQR